MKSLTILLVLSTAALAQAQQFDPQIKITATGERSIFEFTQDFYRFELPAGWGEGSFTVDGETLIVTDIDDPVVRVDGHPDPTQTTSFDLRWDFSSEGSRSVILQTPSTLPWQWQIDYQQRVVTDGRLTDVIDLLVEPVDLEIEYITDSPLSHGDLDMNRAVEFADFVWFSGNFGTGKNLPWAGDLDLDGWVRFPDFVIFANSFGQSSSVATPEPSAFILMALALLSARSLPKFRGLGPIPSRGS